MNSEQTFFLGDPSSAVSNAFISVAHHLLSSCGSPLIWSHCPRQSHQYHRHYAPINVNPVGWGGGSEGKGWGFDKF